MRKPTKITMLPSTGKPDLEVAAAFLIDLVLAEREREAQQQRGRAAPATKGGTMATIVTGAQKDWDTDKWYFIVWADEARTRVKHQSKPIYAEEDQAHAAAAEWVARAAKPSNFGWGKRTRPPPRR